MINMLDEARISAALEAEAERIGPKPDLLARIKRAATPQPWYRRPLWVRTGLAAAAVVGVMFFAAPSLKLGQSNVAYAMEQAAARLTGYHGVMEDGTEIWRDGDRFRILHRDGDLSISDGTTFWEVFTSQQRASKLAASTLSADMDARLNPATIAKMALAYPYEVIGFDRVADRPATKIRVKPEQRAPYHIWIDSETDLPLQWEEGDTLRRFLQFEVNPVLDTALFAFQPPTGYQVEESGERVVASPVEAAALAGFVPLMPDDPPVQIRAGDSWIILDYGTVRITQDLAVEPMRIWGSFAYGTAGGGPLLTMDHSLEWRQDGIRITLYSLPQFGDRYLELARQIAPDLALPDPSQDLVGRAEIKLDVDLTEAQALQEQWRLGQVRDSLRDAENVAMEWIDEQTGQVPLWDEYRIVANTGVQAIMEIDQGPYARVYLQKLVETNADGIWFVTGYDPR